MAKPQASVFLRRVLPALVLIVVLWGCAHAGEATSVSPPPPPPTQTDEGGTLAPSDSSPAAEVASPPVGVASADAAAPPSGPPAPSPPDMTAAPAYPPSALYDAFSKAKPKLIACYLPGKARDAKLRGKVIVKFTVNSNGTVKSAENQGSTLQDDDVIACVARTVKSMHFTKPLEGSVTVVYPLIFHPTGDETLILPDVGKKPSP
jgi:TonB family protein